MAKRKHHSEELIIRILKEAEAGCRWLIDFVNTTSHKEPSAIGRALTAVCKSAAEKAQGAGEGERTIEAIGRRSGSRHRHAQGH